MAIESIQLRLLKSNPLNSERSMYTDEIMNLKESISEVGLLHPLVVYSNNDAEGTFTILSGHKRYAALQAISGPTGTAMCSVVDKPANEVKEGEILARANVHRSTPEEIAKEVSIVNNLWNTMPKERRQYWSDRFSREFEEEYSHTPEYIKDPAGFKSNRFRPRLMYINQITGLGLSNRTITKYINKTLESEGEGFSKKPKKARKITVKSITKAIQSLDGLIDAYEYDCLKPDYLEQLQSALQLSLDMIGNQKKL